MAIDPERIITQIKVRDVGWLYDKWAMFAKSEAQFEDLLEEPAR
jgi:hypothetical protein